MDGVKNEIPQIQKADGVLPLFLMILEKTQKSLPL
jgi:hypothetical protein